MDMNGLLLSPSCLSYIKCSYHLIQASDVFFCILSNFALCHTPEVLELEGGERSFFFQKDMINVFTIKTPLP